LLHLIIGINDAIFSYQQHQRKHLISSNHFLWLCLFY